MSSWWYNWGVTPNQEQSPPEDHCSCSTGSCGPPPANKIFVPMVWGYNEEDRPWHDDINDPVSDKYEVILGFNEPNHADQADIPPEVAASAWLELQNMYPDKVRSRNKKEITFNSIRFWSVRLQRAAILTGLIRSLR